MNKRGFALLVFISCLILLSFQIIFSEPRPMLAIYEESTKSGQLTDMFPIRFYHTAYVDFRYPVPKLRLFTLNGCLRKHDYLLVDVYYKAVVDPTSMKLKGMPLDGECPAPFAPATPCFYVGHSFTADLLVADGVEKVVVHLGSRNVTMVAKEINKRVEQGLTVCLQLAYYYSQWQNIVLYVEAWRAQGASRFIVFYHSATKDVRRVLDYYQKLGIIEIHSWTSFGSLPAKIAGNYPKIDDSVFIFSYFLAMNVCILNIKTTVGAIADFDEVMVHHSGTVLEYALKEMSSTNIGALRFHNKYVTMEPSLYSSNFSGVARPIFVDIEGPPKYIFNASVIDIAQVHWVQSFMDIKKEMKYADGALLHFRYDAAQKTTKREESPFRFFPNNTEAHIQNMQDTANTIFNGSIPAFSPIFLEVFNKCSKKIEYPIPKLRLFSLNGCIGKTNFLLVDVYYQSVVAPTLMKLSGKQLDGNCPTEYGPARPCFYVAHSFTADLLVAGRVEKVVVHLGSRKVTLVAKEINKRVEHGLTVCLQLAYYYSQWQNIVLYVEAWRAQGASRFIVFYHSATKETRRVLDYYQKVGLIVFIIENVFKADARKN